MDPKSHLPPPYRRYVETGLLRRTEQTGNRPRSVVL